MDRLEAGIMNGTPLENLLPSDGSTEAEKAKRKIREVVQEYRKY